MSRTVESTRVEGPLVNRSLLLAARRRRASGYGNGTAIGNAEDIGVGTPS